MSDIKQCGRWQAIVILCLAACTPSAANHTTQYEATAASLSSDQPPRVTISELPSDPISQGEANITGMTTEQIDVMFSEAFQLVEPLFQHKNICLAIVAGADRERRDPPPNALAAFRKLSNLPVVPGSRCAFQTFPYVKESGERAILYAVVVEPRDTEQPISFWAYAIYAKLGKHGAEFNLRRGMTGWVAYPTGARSSSLY